MLERVTVRGFKSIRQLEGFELGRLNVLIGANGAGKSNFISLFNMLAAIMARRLQAFVAQSGGPDALLFGGRNRTRHIDVELVFGNNGYEFSLVPTSSHLMFTDEATRFFGEWSNPRRQLGIGHYEAVLPGVVEDIFASYAQRAITGWRVYHFHDTSMYAGVRQFQDIHDNLILKQDGSNLAPFLRLLREQYSDHYRSILDTIRLAAPFLQDFVYRPGTGERVQLEWLEVGDLDTPRGAIQLSDGTLRFILLVTLLLQPEHLRPTTIVVDEPEIGLHPYAITLLGALLSQASEANQVVVSTQSVDLINEVEPEDVIVADRKDGASVFERLDTEQLRVWIGEYSLGDLWNMNIFGGRP